MRLVPYVYDTGALIAAERDNRAFWARHTLAVQQRRSTLIPAVVLSQAWRGGPRQARLARLLTSCEVVPHDEVSARAVGELLGRSSTSDVVDAAVVELAVRVRGIVITSDPAAIARLASHAGTAVVITSPEGS